MSNKIKEFNAQIDETVKKHGEMLKRRRDLPPEEKMRMQAEMEERAEQVKAEFAQEVTAKEGLGEGSTNLPGQNEGQGQGEGGMGEGGMGAGE